jgi:hypothetical protein
MQLLTLQTQISTEQLYILLEQLPLAENTLYRIVYVQTQVAKSG